MSEIAEDQAAASAVAFCLNDRDHYSQSSQPVLDQFGGAAVQLVGPPFDVGEHLDDSGQVL